jgi:hypothetical protein
MPSSSTMALARSLISALAVCSFSMRVRMRRPSRNSSVMALTVQDAIILTDTRLRRSSHHSHTALCIQM